MLNVTFRMNNDVKPDFTATLSLGQWLGISIAPGQMLAGRHHVSLEGFDATNLRVLDSLLNPLVVSAQEDPGQTFFEITVSNHAADVLHVEVTASTTLSLAPGQTATVAFQRAAMVMRNP